MTNPNVLTATDIDAIPAGRKLDALIAEWVFGYKVDYEFDDPIVEELRGYDDPWGILPSYSTDIATAWEVVEKLRNSFGELVLDIDGDWRFFFGVHLSLSSTAPLAICRAALKAVLTP